MAVEMEQTNGHADQITANQIGRQRAQREGKEYGVERQPQQPSRPCPECSTRANGNKIEGSEVV